MVGLRILCLIDSIGKGGGAEHLIAGLVPKLRDFGVDIAVAPISDWPIKYDDELAAAGIALHPFDAPYLRTSPKSVAAIVRLALRERYDIYWGHLLTGNVHARIGAKLSGGKSIVTIHSEGYGATPHLGIRDKIWAAWQGMILGGANARVGVSRAIADEYGGFYGWDDIAVAYNGVDIARLVELARSEPAAAARARYGIAEDEFLMVTAARYVAKKGQVYLVEALAQLHDRGERGLRLLLCGGGDSAGLRRHAEQRGIGHLLIIEGVIEQAQLLPLVAAADAVVMPSLREPFGIAAAEALALGTPTILTQVDGLLELVGDSETALTVPPADSSALAEKIMQVRRDPDSARMMGQRAAARTAELFSLDACARRWLEIFAAVHEGKVIPPYPKQ